jgi:hypothetical protein
MNIAKIIAIGVLAVGILFVCLGLIGAAIYFQVSAVVIIAFILFAMLITFIVGISLKRIELGEGTSKVLKVFLVLFIIWIVIGFGFGLLQFGYVIVVDLVSSDSSSSTGGSNRNNFVDSSKMYGTSFGYLENNRFLIIEASGKAVWINNPNARPVTFLDSDPDGRTSIPGLDSEEFKQFNKNYLCPDAPPGALIGKVGNSEWFFVGKSFKRRFSKGGAIMLAINDQRPEFGSGNWSDNSGGYNVTVKQNE